MFCLASLVGFEPSCLYKPRLRERLDRYGGLTLVLWGENESVVPRQHADAHFDGFRQGALEVISGCRHSLNLEAPTEIGDIVSKFING